MAAVCRTRARGTWGWRGAATAAGVAGIASALAALAACGAGAPAGPPLQVLGESARLRLEDPLPADSPWFDGERVSLAAARGEVIGLQVVRSATEVARAPRVEVALAIDGAIVRGFAVEAFAVRRASTAMYGGGRGPGRYPDGLRPHDGPVATSPAYFEVEIPAGAGAGVRRGALQVGGRVYPVELVISPVVLAPLPLRVWAYGDPRELAWQSEPGRGAGPGAEARDRSRPRPAELACHAMFRSHGVLLAPDLRLAWWPHRRDQLAGFPYVPVVIPPEPVAAAAEAQRWIAATRGTGQVPFSIPIDEPRSPAARARVREVAAAVRAAGGGPGRFLLAVTADPAPDLGADIDLYIGLRAARVGDGGGARWTYNGAPPTAGSMVLDAATPGTRTWGWIAWRWEIPIWYVWDALYWHDRHNRRGAPLPGRALDPALDPVSFDDGADRGNLDGVLALPAPHDPAGCRRTLRLAALRRGLLDRALLEAAARCAPGATAALAAALVPTALGDAPSRGGPSWPTDEGTWERARRALLALARCGR